MNDVAVPAEQRELAIFKNQISGRQEEMAMALPNHIPVERFMRVAITAANGTPDLLTRCDRRSLFNALGRCAADGLLPDGREAAIVSFKGQAQYLPMVKGTIKVLRNTGEVLSIAAHVVHEKDEFEYELGDDERITHRPSLDADRGDARLVYAIAKLKDGGIQREIMTKAEVEQARKAGHGNTPAWRDWWGEMAKKTVIKRLAKRLPTSAEQDRTLHVDDAYVGAPQAVGPLLAAPAPVTATEIGGGVLPDQTATEIVADELTVAEAAPEAAAPQPADDPFPGDADMPPIPEDLDRRGDLPADPENFPNELASAMGALTSQKAIDAMLKAPRWGNQIAALRASPDHANAVKVMDQTIAEIKAGKPAQ